MKQKNKNQTTDHKKENSKEETDLYEIVKRKKNQNEVFKKMIDKINLKDKN